MNGNGGELSLSAVRAKRATLAPLPASEQSSFPPHEYDFTPKPNTGPNLITEKSKRRLRFDPLRMLAALQARWKQVAWTAGAVALVAALVSFFASDNKVRVTLIARETTTSLNTGAGSEAYRPRQLNSQTLVNLMSSSELLRRVAAKSGESEDSLSGRVTVEQVSGTDLVGLTVSGKSRKSLVMLANLFGEEAVALGRELQIAESVQMDRFCREKLIALDGQLKQVNAELVQFQNDVNLADPDAEKQAYVKQLAEIVARMDNARIETELVALQAGAVQNELSQHSPVAQKLESARNKLTDLLGRYTEVHPTVIAQRRQIADLESQLEVAGRSAVASAKFSDNPLVTSLYSRLVDLQTRKLTLEKELNELAELRQTLRKKVTGLSENGIRYASLKAQVDGLQKSRTLLANQQHEAQLYQEHAQGYYRVFTTARLQDVDGSGRWYHAFLAACAGLILGAAASGLVIVGREIGDGKLKTAEDVRRVTGLPMLATLGDLEKMSAAEREAWAFRTWTAISGQLNPSPNHGLVCGFISAGANEGRSTWIELLAGAAKKRGLRVMTISAQSTTTVTEPLATSVEAGSAKNETRGVWGSQLPMALRTDSDAHLPLHGAVWDLERRKEWQNTLAHWRQVDNLVLLIELPPASVPEAVLLAESLPQVIWLADSGKSSTRETREQLQTLRHARCRLAGAVLNHEPKPVLEL